MDDEGEIDIIGDYNSFETILKKNEEQIMTTCYEDTLGLQCDSQWMMVDSSSQPCWEDPQPSLGLSIDCENSDVWNDKEKYLLEKGLELFGRSWCRLSQYIGTKNSNQVKSYVKSVGNGGSGRISVSTPSFSVDIVDFELSDVINEMEIPASMEEVIAAVSTAQPTVVVSPHRENNSATDHSSRKGKGRHRNNNANFKRAHLITQRKKGSRNIFNAEDIKDVLTGNKEQDSITLPNGEQVIRIRSGSSLSEESEIEIDSDIEEKKNVLNADTCIKEESSHITEKNVLKIDLDNDDKEKTVPIFHIPGEIHNEEVTLEYMDIKCPAYFTLDNIEKEECVFTESDSDHVEVKKNTFQENCITSFSKPISSKTNPDFRDKETHVIRENVVTPTGKEIIDPDNKEKEARIFREDLVTPSGKVITVVVEDLFNDVNERVLRMQDSLSEDSMNIKERLDAVYRLPPPVKELTVYPQHVMEDEKLLHPEFFYVKSSDNVDKYLKIRNSIIERWMKCKPAYVTKESLLLGLINCGDINLINRLHAYLEQKGIINFGCEECHYKNQLYVTQNVENNCVTGNSTSVDESGTNEHDDKPKRESSRVRKKKRPFDECYDEIPKLSTSPTMYGKRRRNNIYGKLETPDGWKSHKKIRNPHSNEGFTMVHTDSGEVIVQHNQTKEPSGVKSKRMKPVRLIHCKHYSATNKAPYKVEVDISALMLVDIHSHLSPVCEVIGLLGGVFQPSDNLVSVVTAVPCKTVLSSNIHCDMCPVSQAEGSELITSQGLSVLGWYHSHPNFDPSPSVTDIDTQNTLQTWFNKTGKPFVGLIISPYYQGNLASSYRVCQVKMEHGGPVPYQLEVKPVSHREFDLSKFRELFEAAWKTLDTSKIFKLSTVEKSKESLRQHLKNSKMNYQKITYLLQVVSDLFNEKIY